MTQRVTGKSVEGQQDNVGQHDQRAQPDTEDRRGLGNRKEKCFAGVVPQERQKQNRRVQEITMDVLQDEWKRSLPRVFAFAAFAHRATRRIQEKCAIVSLAIVIAGSAKTERPAKDKQRSGK